MRVMSISAARIAHASASAHLVQLRPCSVVVAVLNRIGSALLCECHMSISLIRVSVSVLLLPLGRAPPLFLAMISTCIRFALVVVWHLAQPKGANFWAYHPLGLAPSAFRFCTIPGHAHFD
uniref:Uncharacterized protein n=1 Tax=Calcidiscus leptoporus TaxID=127549 RepID=A0A7S0J3C8_9EUKA